ncbi:hypothetical protein [Streptomyces sp. NPDC051219]|uniref:hypothetical protein n=1 Tax=Streptomyces sp. NPDC051219 TaxID=3155283 RepID=UPI0034460E50
MLQPLRAGSALLVASALLAAGCSGGDGGASAAEPPAATTTAAPVTPTESPSPPYPTAAKGCHPNRAWTPKEAVEWVRLEAEPPADNTTAEKGVRIRRALPGYDGPLCEPVTIQVEFWRLTYGAADGRPQRTPDPTEPPADYYFDMASVKRTQLRIDGRQEHLVPLPDKLYAADRSVCVGALVAVYVGKPLTVKELPEHISTGGYIDNVEFRSERVAEDEVLPPTAPQVCSPEGKPTADPAEVPTSPAVPDPLYPTGRPSFDFDDLILPSPDFSQG